MKKILFLSVLSLVFSTSFSQTPKTYSSADILQQLKKLEVFGSVLYIAAHPDDENIFCLLRRRSKHLQPDAGFALPQ